jgi:hypothetical protein
MFAYPPHDETLSSLALLKRRLSRCRSAYCFSK